MDAANPRTAPSGIAGRWSVVLCTCNGSLPWEPPALQEALGLAEPPALYHRLPRDEVHRFVDRVSAGGFERLLVGCCGPADYFREVAGAAGVAPEQVAVLNLKEGCFGSHPDRTGANAKAARMLRAAMRLAARPPALGEVPVKVGSTVLIATSSRAGLDLARRLADVARPRVILDERSAAFDADFVYPLPWKTSWGTVEKVEGTLGTFRVTVSRRQPLDLDACVYCQRCVPVCHTSAISQGLRLRTDLCDQCGDCLIACGEVRAIKIPRADREVLKADQVVVVSENGAPPGPRRTGYHVLRRPGAGDVDALAWTVFGLIGDFRKPQYVHYDPDTCAGGAASHQGCGRCIPACPYDAIARNPRNPLRVQVDLHACEGCGACVSVCPTSSLGFGDPPPAALLERLRGLLAPLPGTDGEAPVVAFHCPEKGASALVDAARRRQPDAASVLPVPMACLRHVSEANMLSAFGLGAAGVALLGCEACPHGERELVVQALQLARTILDAFGLGGERVHLITGEPGEMVGALGRFARSVGPTPVGGAGGDGGAVENRAAVADAIRVLIDATGREPGRVAVPESAPYAFPDVRIQGCTLCRTCVNVCPTHAFRFVEDGQALELKQIACVNCGLCATACPESVITLRHEMFLDRAALDWQVVVQDEVLRCVTCDAPFGNRRAIEVIEAKVLGLAGLLDTFAGARRNLLRMCPNCRAVAAMQEIDRGWEP